MKRCWLGLVVFALLLPANDAGAQQVKLRITIQGPIGNPYYGLSTKRFAEEVERRSQKSISVKVFDRHQLYKGNEVVGAVSSGDIEMGITILAEFIRRIPALGIVDQPFLFNFPALVRAAASPDSEIRKPIDAAILAKTGVRVLWWQSAGSNVIFSKDWDAANPGRIKDKKIRVLAKSWEPMFTQCGGRPMVVPMATTAAAMRDGSIDMVVAGLAALQARSLWKVADTITRTEHSPVEFLLIINERIWQSLSAKHRRIVADVAVEIERQSRDRLAKLRTGAYAFAGSKGMEVRRLTPDQVAEWRACSAGVLADYMEKHGELAHRLMAAYARLRTDPCCTAGPSEGRFTRR